MQLTGSQIRREYQLVMEALNEKFLKEVDPTLVVGEFIQKGSSIFSNIESMYKKNSRNRNSIVDSVLNDLSDLSALVSKTVKMLEQSKEQGPEDINRNID